VIGKLLILTSALAGSLLTPVEAQAPRSAAPAAQEGAARQDSADEKKVNLEGCVFPNRALSSPDPVVAPADSREDFVVTDTKAISASPGVKNVDGQQFKLIGVAQERLRDLSGKRVGVSARVEEKPGMSELNVISILEAVGSCPATPKR